MTDKLCTRCKVTKPLEDFGLRKGKPYSWCKECNREHVRKWNKENPDKALELRQNSKFKKLGVTAEDYWRMHSEQGGTCGACGSSDPSSFIKKRTRFDIDHDHKTGAVRGLLCQACNLVVGLMKDDPANVLKVARYLEKFK